MIARPVGSQVSMALICHSFAVPMPDVDLNSIDPWLYDVSFVNTMMEDLKRSPLFVKGISLDGLKTVLISLEAVFSMDDDRSALCQPYSLQVDDPMQLKSYYQVAFRTLDPSLLSHIWQIWQDMFGQGGQDQTSRPLADCRGEHLWPRNMSGPSKFDPLTIASEPKHVM